MKQVINTNEAPSPLGPYSQAIVCQNHIYISGQLAISAENKLPESIMEQASIIFTNIANILKAADSNLSEVVKTTVYITNIDDFSQVNNVYTQYFDEPYPARAVVEVNKLPLNAKIELDVIAIKQT